MNITPSPEKIKEYSTGGKYNIFPVSCEILSDFITPIEALRVLKNVSEHVYLLESAKSDERWGRYTFLGYNPKTCISAESGILYTDNDTSETTDPAKYIREMLGGYKSPRIETLPPFTGGLVGYFSYEYLSYSEPQLKTNIKDRDNFKDLDLMLFDKVIAFDHVRQKLVIIVNISLTDIEEEYRNASEEILGIIKLLKNGKKKAEEPGRVTGEIKPLFERKEFYEMVEKAKRHIYEGDIFQVVLSNRLSAPFEGSLLDTYRVLRTINPSPYMFYFSGTDVEVCGASPETLVKLENGVLHTFPLAGTRPRGKDKADDIRLEKELLSDEKELAEHNMLVDLGRNDLGRVSKFGTVEVEKLRDVVRFSHVMHIGSTVRGEIRQDKDALDAIEAVLPAGTLSGAPKLKACQIIGELEQGKRGIYGGAIGYIDFTGNMDTCIAIRMVYKKNGKVFVRSGAGIVADSDPLKEYDECINKAKASLYALEKREEVMA